MAIKLDYWRADNMWAAAGRPDGNLGQETVTVDAGQKRVFITDWKYEKQRNDGTNFYGSHGRRLTNSGSQLVEVKLNNFDGILPSLLQILTNRATKGYIRLDPGQTVDIKSDIQEVYGPKA